MKNRYNTVKIICRSGIFADRPTLAYIYQDDNGRHVKVVTVNIDDKELSSPLWRHDNLEGEANMVISVPEPVGGCLIASPDAISYHKGEFLFHIRCSSNLKTRFCLLYKLYFELNSYNHVI